MSAFQKLVSGLRRGLFYLKSELFILAALFILCLVSRRLTYRGALFALTKALLVPAVVIVISSIILIVKSDFLTIFGLIVGGILVSIWGFGAQLLFWSYRLFF